MTPFDSPSSLFFGMMTMQGDPHMRVAILRPVLIGNCMRRSGEEIDVAKARAQRLTRGKNPAARLLDTEDLPQIVRQAISHQESPPGEPPLTLEQMVMLGIQPKVARILIDAGVTSKAQLTEDQLVQIEGVGEKTIELILACVRKDAA